MNGRTFVFAGLLVTLGIVLIFWPTAQDTPTSRPAATPSATATSSASSSAVPEHDHAEGELSPEEEEILQEWTQARQKTAEKFVQAYTNTRLDQADWLAALTPYVTPDLLAGFAYTDLTRIPTGKVAGVSHLAPGDHFRVDFANGEALVCTLTEASAGGWLISSIEPIRTPAPTGNDL